MRRLPWLSVATVLVLVACGDDTAPFSDPGEVGCVVDWAGKFGTSGSNSMDGTDTAAVFGGDDAARAHGNSSVG